LRRSHFGISVIVAVALLWVLQTSRTIPHWGNENVFSAYSIRESPTVPIFHAVKGRFLVTERGDLDGAVKEFETAVRLSASAPEVWPAVAHDAYMGLANIARMKGQFDEAGLDYERAAAKMPANSLAYKELASLYLQRGNLTKVEEFLMQVVKLDPLDIQAQFNLGVCWLRLGKYREAAKQFSAVGTVRPDFPNVREAEAQAREGARQQ
jgi:tetratricopeptide (TPR) repeat protein